MKKILFLFFILSVNVIFSQTKIDTTQVEYVQYEWDIDLETKDATLNSKLTKYKSGFYFEEFKFMNDTTKYGHFLIFKAEKDHLLSKVFFKDYVTALGDALVTTNYDNYGNPDNIVYSIQKIKSQKTTFLFKKKYKRKGKLEFITDEDGTNYYKYNLFGRLKRIEHFRGDILYKISEYRKNRLVSETFPTRKKYRKKFTYAYDKKGRITKRDDNDYYFCIYTYNEFGLTRIDKIRKKNKITISYTLFEYDTNGILIGKKFFGYRDKKPRNVYVYTYE
ncbi:MAG: hypothetical protein AB8B65_20195 [Kordia sp.]|uniref:hypothetical protein n=1 Tax=Kordia sp. TaxID=1965332 RepID=UPI00385CEC39